MLYLLLYVQLQRYAEIRSALYCVSLLSCADGQTCKLSIPWAFNKYITVCLFLKYNTNSTVTYLTSPIIAKRFSSSFIRQYFGKDKQLLSPIVELASFGDLLELELELRYRPSHRWEQLHRCNSYTEKASTGTRRYLVLQLHCCNSCTISLSLLATMSYIHIVPCLVYRLVLYR